MTSSAKKATATKTFTPERDTFIDMVPVHDQGHLSAHKLKVERGIQTVEKEGAKTETEMFKVYAFDGEKFGMGVNALTAWKRALAAGSYGTADDFVEPTFEEEFFQVAAKTNDKADANPWEREDADELRDLRDRADAAYSEAQKGEASAQDSWREMAVTLSTVRDKFTSGNKGKQLAAWIKGPNGAAALAMSSFLTEGKNAISEACRLAELSDEEYAVLPATVTRGKTVDLFLRDSVSDYYTSIAERLAADGKACDKDANGNRTISSEQFEDAARVIFEMFSNGSEGLPIEDAIEMAEETAKETAAKHANVYGKSSEETSAARTSALRAMGQIQIVKQLDAADKLDAQVNTLADMGDESTIAKVFKERNATLFVRRVNAALVSLENKAATDKANSALQKAVDDAGDLVAPDSGFKKTPADIVAARMFNTLVAHPAYAEIYSKLGVLVRSAVEADKEKAKAKAAKAA